METRIARWLVQGRVGCFIVALLLTAAAAAGASRLWFESDFELFFSDDDPQLVAYKAIQNAYTKVDNVAFILAPDSGEVFSAETLSAVQWLTAQGWTLPRSIRVDSISNFQHSRAEGDELIVANLVPDDAPLDAAQRAQIREAALSEPALVNLLLSDRGDVTSVNVRFEMPDDSQAQGAAMLEIMDAAHALVTEFRERYPDIGVHLSGQVAVNDAFNQSAERDAGTLVPLMFLVVLILLVLFLRSLTAVAATVLVIITSILTTVGITGWYGYHLNQVNVSAPIIILTLSVSDCVHVILAYIAALRRGLAKPVAMEEALRLNLVPVFLTSLTTAIGFFSLNFSDSPPFRELGNSVGTGVFAAMLWTLMLLPTLLIALPMRAAEAPKDTPRRDPYTRLADLVLRHHRAFSWGTMLLALALAANAVRNDLNDDTVEYFKPGTTMRQSLDFVEQHLTGLDSIMYSLPAGGENGIYDPAYLHQVEAFAEWWREQPRVAHVTTFTDIIKRLNRDMNGGDPAYYRIPDDRELAAQYVLLYELSLPLGLDLNDLVSFDKSATRFSVSIHNVKAQALIDYETRAQQWLSANAPAIQSHGSGVSLMFAHIGQNNIYSMMKGSALALLLISATLIVTLRSFKFGLLSLLPNAFPAAIAFGLWGLFVGEVNLAVAAVFSITLGIVVDNTIHFFSKYLHARRVNGASTEDAVRYAYRLVGAALTVTAAALGLGFAVLAFSDFGVNSSMGIMTAMTIVIALIFDLLFLPGLMMRFDRREVAAP